MIDFEKAKTIVSEKLLEIQKFSNIKLSIMYEETLEFDFGWIFFYQSEEFVKTKDPLTMVGGNAPILVDKQFAIAIPTGTSQDINYYINVYSRFKKEW